MGAGVLAILSLRAGTTSEDDDAGDDEEAEEHRQVVDREALLHEGAGLLSGVTQPYEAVQRTHQPRSEEHTSELQSLMRLSYAVFCLKKKKQNKRKHQRPQQIA